MPLYNYKCTCGNAFEAFNTIKDMGVHPCECGKLAEQTLSRPPAVHGFKYGFFEHISHDGEYIKSRRHLRQACIREGCYAPYILD